MRHRGIWGTIKKKKKREKERLKMGFGFISGPQQFVSTSRAQQQPEDGHKTTKILIKST